jgi:hypothetical protein
MQWLECLHHERTSFNASFTPAKCFTRSIQRLWTAGGAHPHANMNSLLARQSLQRFLDMTLGESLHKENIGELRKCSFLEHGVGSSWASPWVSLSSMVAAMVLIPVLWTSSLLVGSSVEERQQPGAGDLIEASSQSLQSNNLSSRFTALSLWSSIVKCSKKYTLGTQHQKDIFVNYVNKWLLFYRKWYIYCLNLSFNVHQ